MFPGTCRTLQTFCWRTCWTPATCPSPITKQFQKERMRSLCRCKSPSGYLHQAFEEPSRKTHLLASKGRMRSRTAEGRRVPRCLRRPRTCTIASAPQTRKATWIMGGSTGIRLDLTLSFFVREREECAELAGLRPGPWPMQPLPDRCAALWLQCVSLAKSLLQCARAARASRPAPDVARTWKESPLCSVSLPLSGPKVWAELATTSRRVCISKDWNSSTSLNMPGVRSSELQAPAGLAKSLGTAPCAGRRQHLLADSGASGRLLPLHSHQLAPQVHTTKLYCCRQLLDSCAQVQDAGGWLLGQVNNFCSEPQDSCCAAFSRCHDQQTCFQEEVRYANQRRHLRNSVSDLVRPGWASAACSVSCG